jgi:P27 family predicted phage terminase small subunit
MSALRPPERLGAAARAAWRRAVGVLRELGEDPALSAEPLAAYARAAGDAAHLRARWRKLGSPVTTEGSRGQLAVHPLVGEIERAERWAHELGESLGLDPQSRRRLARRVGSGRPPGAASAPDRVAAAPPRRQLKAVE